MKLFFCVVLAGLLGHSAQSATLEWAGEKAKTLKSGDTTVEVHSEAKVLIPSVTGKTPTTVYLTGAGLREKPVVFFDVDVYFALSYWDHKEALSSKNPQDDLKKSKVKVMQLVLLRDLSADKIRDSFADALKENGVDLKSNAISGLLKALSFDVKEGARVTIVGYTRENGTQGIWYELEGNPNPVQVEGARIADDFWSVWFGKPADGGLKELKKALVSGA